MMCENRSDRCRFFALIALGHDYNNNDRFMKITLKNVALGLAICGLVSCANEAPWSNGIQGKGGVNLKLTADADVKDAMPSVRAGEPELVAPDVSYFSVEMLNLDTELKQTFSTLEDFNNQDGFDVGSYTLTAYYGNINECGFEKPYFMGEANVNVLKGRESSVEVIAQLANVMLSVEYTDAFKDYFRDYSVTAHTDGHANVTFGKYETRAGFLAPGDVSLQISVTNPNGQTVTLTPKDLELQAIARHHYHVKFDVNADPMGDMTLTVVFDDSTTKEDVHFTLSDELYSAEAPVVESEGFTSGQMIEALSGNPSESLLKFESTCKAGFQSAKLKIAQIGGDPYTLPFDSELELVNADESTQNVLAKNGIKVGGLYKNPDQMAFVDVTELPKYLPTGTFEITLTVTDALGRNNETPVVLNLSTQPINLHVTGGSAVYAYSDRNAACTGQTVDATVFVVYNGLHPETAISFRNKCYDGSFKNCEIVDVKESSGTRGFLDKTYIFNIKVCDVETSPLPMEIWFNDKEYPDKENSKFSLDIIEPKFTLEADPFAKYARFRVNPENPGDLATIVNGLKLYKDGKAQSGGVSRDPEKGILTMDGLDPDKDYVIGYSLTSRSAGVPESQTLKIHTEVNKPLSNGDFSKSKRTIDQDMQVGGVYKAGAFDYTNWSQVKVDEPTDWCSINDKTFFKNAKTPNSWFTVVSTYLENGQVVVRSVGYDHNGTLPDRTGSFFSTTYYNTNTPNISSKAAGELFLGTYSFDGKETREDGIEFKSRPTSVSFDCSYSPYETDMGVAKAEVLDASGKVIASGERNIYSSSMHTEVISLSEYPFGSKAASIRIQFKSSREEFTLNIPNPNVDSWSGTLPTSPYHHNLGENNYHSYASGSVLTIDYVKLNY